MAIAVVASTSKGSTTNGDVTTSGGDAIDSTGATLLVAAVSAYDAGVIGTITVTDSVGGNSNTWTPATIYTADDDATQVAFYYSVPTYVGSGHTFTSNTGNSGYYPTILVVALSGAHATPFDTENGGESTGLTIQPGNVSPSEDNCIVLSACAKENGTINSIAGGLTIIENVAASGTNICGALAYEIQTAKADRNPTWTISSSVLASAASIVFKAAASANITIIDSVTGGSTNGNADAVTSAMDTTGADLLIVSISEYDAGISGTATATDSKSNTWTPLTTYIEGGGSTQVRIWYCVPPAGKTGSSHTFTGLTDGLSVHYGVICALAVSGSNSSPFDQENGAESSSSATQQPGSVTPGQDNEIVVTAVATEAGTITADDLGVGMTIAENNATVGGQHITGALAYIIQTSAGAINPTWTASGAANISAAIATFKSVSAGGGASPRQWRLTLLGVG